MTDPMRVVLEALTRRDPRAHRAALTGDAAAAVEALTDAGLLIAMAAADPSPEPCPACGDPAGPCDFLCVDPGCDARDCQSHETCERVPWLEHHHEIDSGGNCRDPKCGWNSDEARERELFGGPYPGDPPGTHRVDGPMCVVPPAPRDPQLRDAAEIVARVTGPAQ